VGGPHNAQLQQWLGTCHGCGCAVSARAGEQISSRDFSMTAPHPPPPTPALLPLPPCSVRSCDTEVPVAARVSAWRCLQRGCAVRRPNPGRSPSRDSGKARVFDSLGAKRTRPITTTRDSSGAPAAPPGVGGAADSSTMGSEGTTRSQWRSAGHSGGQQQRRGAPGHTAGGHR
jgi:hypothetical protein